MKMGRVAGCLNLERFVKTQLSLLKQIFAWWHLTIFVKLVLFHKNIYSRKGPGALAPSYPCLSVCGRSRVRSSYPATFFHGVRL